MTNQPYLITTTKTWHETMRELEEQMRMWGVNEWETNYPRGARIGARAGVRTEKEADRTVELTYKKNNKTVTLVMNTQNRAVDNLRVLYLAVEAMRLNERRGISDVIESAYLQLAAPDQTLDPYDLLEIRPGASLDIAEAAYKAKMRNLHPDKGGSEDQATKLNSAIKQIREANK